MSYTTWSLVYGEQPSTAKWNILGTNDSHFYGFLGDNVAWQSYTPTLTNMTLGNGTRKGYYAQIGNTVFVRFLFLLGNTSAMGSAPNISLPVTSNYTSGIIGVCLVEDASASSFAGTIALLSSTTAQIDVWNATGAAAVRNSITSTVPMTWTTNDYLAAQFSYEAAP